MKRNTIEFNRSNNWSSEIIENKELSLPSYLPFMLGEKAHVIYNIRFLRKVEIFVHCDLRH